MYASLTRLAHHRRSNNARSRHWQGQRRLSRADVSSLTLFQRRCCHSVSSFNFAHTLGLTVHGDWAVERGQAFEAQPEAKEEARGQRR